MTNISVLPVQNGTTVLSLSVISYVERYKSFARQTAESIIGVSSLDRMVQKGSILNLLFYGKPGIGKTSAARILINQLGADVYELNGSLSNGDKTTVRNIEAFASTLSLTGQPKICFIDEADYLSKEIQASLRAVIERVQHNTRFILTANEVEKLSPAIRSRCTQLNFDVRAVDAASIMERMTTRYSERLSDLG